MAGEQPWLLPVGATRGRSPPRNPHADPKLMNNALEHMPGVDVSPHGFRRAFASYGQRDLGFAVADTKLILDHLEGAEVGDVTAEHYALDPQLSRKREMMTAWCAWLDARVAEALSADPTLAEVEMLREAIYRARYGDERWARKVARARKTGEPLWQDDDLAA